VDDLVPLLLLALRLLLAGVFLVAAIGKLLDRAGSRRAFVEFGLPERVAAPLTILLPAAELAIAVALVLPATARLGALGALALLVAFTAGIGFNLARGRRPDCHCFGQIHSAPAGRSTLIRNGGLATLAGVLLVVGWDDPGPGPLDWTGAMTAGELAALAVGAVGIAAAAAVGWFALLLARSHGRLQLAVDELRQQLDARGSVPDAAIPASVPRGLPIGRVAPSFELEDLDGRLVTLDSLVGTRTLMLAFIDPDCQPCRSLVPDLARWQERDDLAVVPISRGSVSANRRELRHHALRGVLLQQDREVADAFEVQGTPSAVLIGADGRIASSLAGGAEAVRALAGMAPREGRVTQAAVIGVPGGGNGHRPDPTSLDIGAKVPSIELADLDGRTIDLSTRDRDGDGAVLLFWRPSCGFCTRLAPEVKAWAARAATGGTDLILVALDGREANAALDLGASIVLDPDMAAFEAFGATGTPVAVKIDRRGRVASPLAVGTDQVRGLAIAAGLAAPADRPR
jgi:peroxiredoxin